MRTFRSTVRRALDRARRLPATLTPTSRWSLTFAGAANLSTAILWPPAATAVDPTKPPTARLQLVVKSIHVFDNRELIGSAEMSFYTALCYGTSEHECFSSPIVSWNKSFSADSGETKQFDRVLPVEGDAVSGGATTLYGVPVYAGEHYTLYAGMNDIDCIGYDELGTFSIPVDEVHGWDLGTHTVRSIHDDGSPGDFDVTFEMRRTPLPDLRTIGVRQIESEDGHFYCVQVENVGERPSELAPLAVRANGLVLRQPALRSLGSADLTVRATKVNGRAPDDKDDCKDANP